MYIYISEYSVEMNAICHMVWVYSYRNFKQKDLMYYCLPIIQKVQQKW